MYMPRWAFTSPADIKCFRGLDSFGVMDGIGISPLYGERKLSLSRGILIFSNILHVTAERPHLYDRLILQNLECPSRRTTSTSTFPTSQLLRRYPAVDHFVRVRIYSRSMNTARHQFQCRLIENLNNFRDTFGPSLGLDVVRGLIDASQHFRSRSILPNTCQTFTLVNEWNFNNRYPPDTEHSTLLGQRTIQMNRLSGKLILLRVLMIRRMPLLQQMPIVQQIPRS